MARYTDISVSEAFGKVTLDFSRFHDLDHSLSDCKSKAEHVRLWWSYRGIEMITGAFVGTPWRLIACPLGKHWWLQTLDLSDNSQSCVCAWCEVRR